MSNVYRRLGWHCEEWAREISHGLYLGKVVIAFLAIVARAPLKPNELGKHTFLRRYLNFASEILLRLYLIVVEPCVAQHWPEVIGCLILIHTTRLRQTNRLRLA